MELNPCAQVTLVKDIRFSLYDHLVFSRPIDPEIQSNTTEIALNYSRSKSSPS